MNRLKKFLLGFVVVITMTGIATAIYLFTDNPFPDRDTTGLIKTESS